MSDAPPTEEASTDEALIVVCRAVAGEHIGGAGCWCRPVTLRPSDVDAYLTDHPGDTPVGLDS